MHHNSRAAFTFLCFVSLLLLMGSGLALPQNQTASQTAAQNANVHPTPLPSDIDPADPALPVWMRPATPPPQPKTANVPSNVSPNGADVIQPGRAGEVTKAGRDRFGMRVNVQNVTLPVTVVDDKRRLVTDLRKNDFTVYENGEEQEILGFSREDVPVSIGILVDNSGSMRDKREKVSTAVLNLIKASNPNDEEFVVNFNDDRYLDQDFTNNLGLLHEALDRLDSRGGTALYDAVIASTDHLAKAAKREKKVLLVITDGEDNESINSLEQTIRAVQDENGPMIYTIGILGNEGKQHRAKRALEGLSFQTGGVAFFPKNLEEVDAISQQVAHDIRNQYTIVYKPTNPPNKGEFRQVKVVARSSGHGELTVRTKTGYFAGEQRASATSK